VRWIAILVVLLVAFLAGYTWFVNRGAQHTVQTQPASMSDDGNGAGGGNGDAAPDAASITAAQALAGVELAGGETNPGAAGSSGIANLGAIDDPDQRRSVCGYLTSELDRLGYEFHQPLPPPVIDRIATKVAQLHGQISRYGCIPGKGISGANTLDDVRLPASSTPRAVPLPIEVPPSAGGG
jgi:hypothetical protein